MATAHNRMAHLKILERDAHAALTALSREEKETLRGIRAGLISEIPDGHERHLIALCLGAYRAAGFGLTELGRCAADQALGYALGGVPDRQALGPAGAPAARSPPASTRGLFQFGRFQRRA